MLVHCVLDQTVRSTIHESNLAKRLTTPTLTEALDRLSGTASFVVRTWELVEELIIKDS